MENNIRPWGHYDILLDSDITKVKKITVIPGGRLSYQSHEHRSETWTIVSGCAKVVIDDTETELGPEESVYIRDGQKHRISNTTKKDLIFIEVQHGKYFGEDDIIRYEDDYART